MSTSALGTASRYPSAKKVLRRFSSEIDEPLNVFTGYVPATKSACWAKTPPHKTYRPVWGGPSGPPAELPLGLAAQNRSFSIGLWIPRSNQAMW